MANRLINEQSAYLLQHAQNPVDWYPWGDEAFRLARQAHKPVLVSIGYAACHWCHVMEHESFEDEAVAAYMNEHFICIKVDREEHPDVDHFYMDAVQAIGGSGGWPLNVFVTADRAPFYGGTYYPPRPAYNRPSWPQLLQRMVDIWHEHHDEVTTQAAQMIQHLQQASQKLSDEAAATIPGIADCTKIAETLLAHADKQKGGFGSAPKFPGTMAITYLLEHYYFAGHKASQEHALKSLEGMINGGIYDQLGGGFARYSTDREWLAPHFEKMLYDNALLIISLCDAWSSTGQPLYLRIIKETITFAERELKDPSGGYYCALDADSEGVEGKFYTWTWDEWINDIGSNVVAQQYFGIVLQGNWEGTNILHVAQPLQAVAAANNITEQEAAQIIDEVKKTLLAVREKRIRPQTDDKCLLSWNALMNIALSKAAMCLRTADAPFAAMCMQRAKAHMQWMVAAYDVDGTMQHTWKNGTARIAAKLDDYAYLIQAMLQLATAAADNEWIVKAAGLTANVISNFGREDGMFYYTAEGQKDIPVRKVDLYDGATPSANAVMAHNLWLCGLCMEHTDWLDRSARMLGSMLATATRYSYSFSCWASLMQKKVNGIKTVVCSGSDAGAAMAEIQSQYHPHVYVLNSVKEISEMPLLEKKYFNGKLLIFVCTEHACMAPVTRADKAFELLNP